MKGTHLKKTEKNGAERFIRFEPFLYFHYKVIVAYKTEISLSNHPEISEIVIQLTRL
jgi:hypothetical protein